MRGRVIYETVDIDLFGSWLEYTSSNEIQFQLLSGSTALLIAEVIKLDKILICRYSRKIVVGISA